MNIGQAIKELRMKQGMTQEQLAAKCGMSNSVISNWELGKAEPPKASIEKLCEAFGISRALFQLAVVDENDFPEDKRVLYRALLEPLRNELLDKGNNCNYDK